MTPRSSVREAARPRLPSAGERRADKRHDPRRRPEARRHERRLTRAPGRLARALAAALLAACAEPSACPAADLSPPERAPAFAVVASDYSSTAVALLDADGVLIREAWVDSGTVPPGVVAALSGDVAIPATPVAECVLAVIDRWPAAVVTFLDLCAQSAEDAVVSQLDVSDGFASNPHDVLGLGDGRALVSRHAPSPHGEGGNDLLVVDWRDGRVLSRIDLAPLDARVDDTHVLARPSRMAPLEAGEARRVLVGLARLDRDWMVAGPGAVAVLEPAGGAVEAVALPGLANCGEVDPVPGRPALAAVTCSGETWDPQAGTWAGEEARRATAGVALLELGADGAVRVRATWRAAEHPAQPSFNAWAVPLDAERVVATAMGDFGRGIDDRVGVLGLDGAETTLLMEADDAFVVGDGAFDPASGLLLIPDAHAGAVRRFRREGDGALRPLEPVDVAGCRGLPPREVRRLRVADR